MASKASDRPAPRPEGGTKSGSQREALKRSEKRAAAQQPESFKDAETAEKIVEVGPDMDDAPIEGIDPPERKNVERP
jgi:hypothetical protein